MSFGVGPPTSDQRQVPHTVSADQVSSHSVAKGPSASRDQYCAVPRKRFRHGQDALADILSPLQGSQYFLGLRQRLGRHRCSIQGTGFEQLQYSDEYLSDSLWIDVRQIEGPVSAPGMSIGNPLFRAHIGFTHLHETPARALTLGRGTQ